MSAGDSFDEDDEAGRLRLEHLASVADAAIAAGFDVLAAAVWPKDDGTLSKAPLHMHGHLDAHRDRQLIRQQLAVPPYMPPSVPREFEVVVGFVPGSGGCVVLDADVKLGKVGMVTLKALADEHGQFHTAVWRTPSGGRNVLLTKPTGATFSNTSPWQGIDVRADGGWCVAPGCCSVGGEWAWLPPSSFGTASPIPAAMAAQLSMAAPPGRRASNAETVAFIEASPTALTLPVMQRFSAELDKLRASGPGSRHEALVRIISWAFGMNALDLRWAMEQVHAVWQTLTPRERRDAEPDVVACWVAGREIDKRAAQQPPPNVDPATGEIDVDDDDAPVRGLDLVDWGELYAGTHTEDPVVDGLAFRGRWTAIAAPAKAGKSTLTMHVAVNVQAGHDPFNPTTCPPLRVLYLDAEMGRIDVLERLDALGLQPADLAGLHYTDVVPRLDTVEGASLLVADTKRLGVDLVIIDGINGAVTGAENDDTTWRSFYDWTVAPLKRLGVALVTNDNLGKDRTLGPRGSSVKVDKPDAVLEMRHTEHGVQLKTTHRRTAAYPLEQGYRIDGLDGAEPITYHATAQSWPPGTSELVTLLDRLGVPLADGRRNARHALNDARDQASAAGDDALAATFRATDRVIDAACRHRRNGLVGTP